MPKVKVPRKSTNIDMTAMCDVAFLLLSFFILTTKFKPPEALTVVTPKSVSTKTVNTKNSVTIILDKEGKAYFSVSDDNTSEKGDIIDYVDQQKQLGLTAQQKNAFKRGGSYVGVPFSQLKSLLSMSGDQLKGLQMPGIPVTDTLNNEMTMWLRATADAFQGKTVTVFLKGDNLAKYPSLKGVIDALKKNDIMKFSMITNPEAVPAGTDLYNKNKASGGKATDAQ
jgi:biopolymer transport protein ExbD